MNELLQTVGAELRRHPRVTMLRDIRIKPHPEGAPAVPGILHDLTCAGVGISTSLRLQSGDRFAILMSYDGRRSTSTQCRVVHVFPVTDGWWAIGAEFVTEEPADSADDGGPRCA